MFSDITIDKLLDLKSKNAMTLIDVRSPSEYRNSTIPGSMNIPLFNDEERAEIGTIYKQISPEAAEDRGLEIVSAKLPEFVREFKKVEGEKTVFCWRGGMRSKTSATLLDLARIHVHRLEGGVRSYRKWVVDTLEHLDFHPETFILSGYTGTGKTIVLRELQEQGYPVLDLEKMANHRGSIFGQIGLAPNNQKTFEALLVERIRQITDSKLVLFEAESKRIGKVVLPPFFDEWKAKGTHIIIDMPIEERVRNILADYDPWAHKEESLEAFRRIKARIHTPVAKEIEQALVEENFPLAVRLLLEYYYDSRYQHAADQYAENKKVQLTVANAEEAVYAIKEIVSKKRIAYQG